MASTYLEHTLSAAGTNGNKKATFSAWMKRAKNGAEHVFYTARQDSNNFMRFRFNSDQINVTSKTSGTNYYATTSAVYRDPTAFYHVVVTYDTTNATEANRIRIYVNGVEQSKSASNYPSQDATLFMIASGQPQRVGQESGGGYFDGVMSHVHYTEGYAYAASDFGETDSTTGQWTIKTAPSVTYGTNGFFVLKDGNGVTDQSGQGNNFTANGNLTITQDCPDNNFCTLNPLGTASASFTLIEGNLYSGGADNNWRSIFGTLGAIAGKYYYEVKIISSANEHIGIASADQMAKASDSAGKFTASTYGTEGYAYTNGGQKSNNGTDTNWGNSYTTNDIIGVALDLDNSKIYFSKNGTWQESGDPTSGSTGTGAAYTLVANKFYLPAMASYGAASNMAFNFGNGYFRTTAIASEGSNASGIGKFEYDVPTGYTALSTKGLNE